MVEDFVFRFERAEANLALQTALLRRVKRQMLAVAHERRVLLFAIGPFAHVNLLARTVHFYVVFRDLSDGTSARTLGN